MVIVTMLFSRGCDGDSNDVILGTAEDVMVTVKVLFLGTAKDVMVTVTMLLLGTAEDMMGTVEMLLMVVVR